MLAFFLSSPVLVQSFPMLTFCTSDVAECMGVDGVFASRDPNSNCEFKWEDCEGPNGTRSADEAFQLRGSQEDYDRVLAVPARERRAKLESIREAITIANGSEGPRGTRSADEAFQLKGSQAHYDRVIAMPVHKRRAELELIRAEVNEAEINEGPNGTRSADEAFQLRGSQEDYDRVLAVPVHERRAK